MGRLEGNAPASDNDWEAVKRGGDPAIKRWINGQLSGKSCVVVLVGTKTASRKWVKWEIERAWALGKAVVAIHINKLKNLNEEQAAKGTNPLTVTYSPSSTRLSALASCYTPQGQSSPAAYASIKANIADWIEDAIETRKRYP